MKKLISAIAALSVCAAMLTACGGEENTAGSQDDTASVSAENTVSEASEISDDSDNSGSSDNSDSAGNTVSGEEPKENNDEPGEGINDEAEASSGQNVPADKPEEDNTPGEVPVEEIVFDESGDDDEPEDVTVSNPVFASLNEFAESDLSMLPFESVSYSSSHTYSFIKKFDGTKALHLDVTDLATGSFLSLYLDSKNSRLAMTMVRGDIGAILPIIVKDSKMYILDPVSMTGMYMDTDKSVFTDILSLTGVDKEAVSGSKNVNRCKVTVGGREYVFENSNGGGFLFEADGSPYAVVSSSESLDLTIMEINEFSENIPEGVFDIPEDYELIEDTGA